MMDRFIMEIADNAIASNLQCNHKPRALACVRTCRDWWQTRVAEQQRIARNPRNFPYFFFSPKFEYIKWLMSSRACEKYGKPQCSLRFHFIVLGFSYLHFFRSKSKWMRWSMVMVMSARIPTELCNDFARDPNRWTNTFAGEQKWLKKFCYACDGIRMTCGSKLNGDEQYW